MRVLPRRKKKLTIAFWLHSHGEPGWKCAECRVLKLEGARRCGHLGMEAQKDADPVWSKGGVVLSACPKPLVTGASRASLEAYALWLASGRPSLLDANAKCVDALLHLDRLAAAARGGSMPATAADRR